MGVLVITVATQGDYERKRNETPQQSGFVGAFSGFAQAIRFFGRAGGTQDVLSLLLPVLTGSDLEGKTLTEPGPLAVPGKGGDVGEYLRPALSGRDESKAAVIVPFCKRAVYAHKYTSLAPLISQGFLCWRIVLAVFDDDVWAGNIVSRIIDMPHHAGEAFNGNTYISLERGRCTNYLCESGRKIAFVGKEGGALGIQPEPNKKARLIAQSHSEG